MHRDHLLAYDTQKIDFTVPQRNLFQATIHLFLDQIHKQNQSIVHIIASLSNSRKQLNKEESEDRRGYVHRLLSSLHADE